MRAAAALGLLALGLGLPAQAQAPEGKPFEPQVKINHVDTSKAPLIRIYASVLNKGAAPVPTDLITKVSLLRKPDGESPEELFAFTDGELSWPADLEPEELAKREAQAVKPELTFANALKEGAAIVIVAPGFQDLEYRAGALGSTSRSSAALLARKLGVGHQMNVIWYNDFVHAFVYKQGHTGGLTPLTPEILDSCRKWQDDAFEFWGLSPEEIAVARGEDPNAAPAEGPAPKEARCGLHPRYETFSDILSDPRLPYEGYWPQLFGLGMPYKVCQVPEFPIKRTGLSAEGEEARPQALDVALEMLARDARPGQPRILILTGDGRDGYIKALEECRFQFDKACDADAGIAALTRRSEASPSDWMLKKQLAEARKKCVDAGKAARASEFMAAEQAVFAKKLPIWLGLAKAADIRIYSVIHPTGTPGSRERLELLAWRSGGTPRYAASAEEVGSASDALVEELNGQLVLTFADETVSPKGAVAYVVKATAGTRTFTSEPFEALIPPRFEPGLVAEVKAVGEAKLGKGGFLAVAIAVGLLLLVVVLKVVMKFVKGGEAAAAKAVKGGKGADKARAKAIAAAKKAKEAQKKAKGG